MKLSFNNILLPLLFAASSFSIVSCSDDNEVKPDPTEGLTQITSGYALGAGAKVEVWAKQAFFSGLNQVYLVLYDSGSGKQITNAQIHLHPVMDMMSMSHSCPVLQPELDAVNNLFSAEIVFTMPSGEMGTWTLQADVNNKLNDKSGTVVFDINVEAPALSKVISFQAESGKRYYLSYLFPEKTKVGVNDFDVIAYTYADGEFIPEENLTITLTPEMPSMGHGSPNNVNPVYNNNGHYKGKANFTMTGDWRLNLGLKDGDADLGARYFDLIVE